MHINPVGFGRIYPSPKSAEIYHYSYLARFFVCLLCGHRVNHAVTLAIIVEGAQY